MVKTAEKKTFGRNRWQGEETHTHIYKTINILRKKRQAKAFMKQELDPVWWENSKKERELLENKNTTASEKLNRRIRSIRR